MDSYKFSAPTLHWRPSFYQILASEQPQDSELEFESGRTVNTSFLVPEEFLELLSDQIKGTFSAKIRNLLEESAFMIYYGKISPKRTKITRTYQEKNKNLKKVSCRVQEGDLLEMDMMAQSLGISRSRLLSLLLEWESVGWLVQMRELGVVRDTTFFKQLHIHHNFDRARLPRPVYKISVTQIIDS